MTVMDGQPANSLAEIMSWLGGTDVRGRDLAPQFRVEDFIDVSHRAHGRWSRTVLRQAGKSVEVVPRTWSRARLDPRFVDASP